MIDFMRGLWRSPSDIARRRGRKNLGFENFALTRRIGSKRHQAAGQERNPHERTGGGGFSLHTASLFAWPLFISAGSSAHTVFRQTPPFSDQERNRFQPL